MQILRAHFARLTLRRCIEQQSCKGGSETCPHCGCDALCTKISVYTRQFTKSEAQQQSLFKEDGSRTSYLGVVLFVSNVLTASSHTGGQFEIRNPIAPKHVSRKDKPQAILVASQSAL